MPDPHVELLLEEYKTNLPTYKKINEIVNKQLHKFVQQLGILVNSVETRVKTYDSLKGKLELKGYKYKTLLDITDLVGGRIVTFYKNEVDTFAGLIEKTFDIDWDNTIDKRKMYSVDQFGYMSMHLICRIPESLYKEEDNPLINEVRFELQVRTTLQHVWASIYHDTGYKSDVEVPKEYLRGLIRLAGLLEIADEEFSSIKSNLEEYRRQIKQVVKQGKFEDVELNKDTFQMYIDNGGFTKFNKHVGEINNMEIEHVNLMPFLPLLKYYGFNTLNDLEMLKKEFGDDAYKIASHMFSGTDIDIITDFVIFEYLCISYAIRNGAREEQIKKVLDFLHGPRASNVRQASRIVETARKTGLLHGE